MRLMKDIPEIEMKLESGALTLSVVAQAARHFRQEETPRGVRREVLEMLQGKSTREAKRELAARSSQAIPEERIRAVSAHQSELRVVLEEDVLRDLEKIKGLLAHARPEMTTAELIATMAKLTLERI